MKNINLFLQFFHAFGEMNELFGCVFVSGLLVIFAPPSLLLKALLLAALFPGVQRLRLFGRNEAAGFLY